MGLWMSNIEYLSERRLLPAEGCRILDIGSQNLYFATPETVRRFVLRHGRIAGEAAFLAEAERISYFSTPRPGERTAYVSELFDLTPDIFYTSYDVCPALKTEIFDLNVESCPAHYRGTFDCVLNFGTTEHIFNQTNSYRVMHDAIKVGGIAFHQVPGAGWIGHGYFTYQPPFFDDLVRSNEYELVDRWYTAGGQSGFDPSIEVRDPARPQVPVGAAGEKLPLVANYNLNVVLRKRIDAPFRVGLELATSHAALSDEIAGRYADGRITMASG